MDKKESQKSFDIFISYRRADSAWVAGRIHDFLKNHFEAGRIFRDTEQLRLGTKFTESIEFALQKCKAMIVPIGSKWLTISDQYGRRRLDNESDWVRTEIRTALQRDILVIPVYFDGTPLLSEEALPQDLKGLTEMQGITDLQDKWFIFQMINLIDALNAVVEKSEGGEYPHINDLREIIREELLEDEDFRDKIIMEENEYSYHLEASAESNRD
jgi:hypothetical protein